MSKPIFEEVQRFRQWWLWLVLLFALAAILFKGFKTEMDNFITPIVIMASVLLLLFLANLKTRIDERGIHIRFFPFHFSFRTYEWDKLYSAEVKKYSPIGEYGGWGVRISLTGNGKAFNVSGNKGIYIVTSDGKKRMIGTKKEVEAQEVLKQYISPSKNE